MAGGSINLATLEAILRLRDEMSPALKTANQNVGAFSGVLGKLAGMVGGVLSVGAAISAVNKAFMAQSESEAAINKLNLALANQGMYTAKTSQALLDYASALEDVSTFDDEAVIGAEALLVAYGMNEEQIRRTLKAAADFAAATGSDLQSAVQAVTRGVEGQGRAFKAYGIEVEDTGTKTKNLDVLLGQLEQKFGGSALNATKTYAGSMAQLENEIGNAWEAAGKFLGFLTSTGDKPFAGLIKGAEALQKLFGVTLPLVWTEFKARMAESLAAGAESLAKLFDLVGKLPGVIGEPYRRAAEDLHATSAELERNAAKWREQGNAAAASAGNIQEVTNKTGPARDRMNELTEAGVKAAEAAAKHATETQKLNFALDGMAFQLGQASLALEQHLSTFVDLSDFVPITTKEVEAFNAALGQGPEMDPDVILGPIRQLQAEMVAAAPTLGNALKEGLGKGLEALPGVIVGAIQGGGDIFRAVGAQLGGDLGEEIGKNLGAKLGGNLGKIVSSLGGPLGSLLGSLAGKALDALAGAFGIGGNKVIMKVNDMRDAFFEAQGGFVALQKKLVGLTDQDLVKKIFDAKTVDQFNAAVKEVTDLLGLQTQSEQALQDAIKKYGFTIDELGPKWKQQELDKMAAGLLQDYSLLVASGIDVNTVIAKMAPNMNEYVQTALRAGQAIPENMKPIIDKMIETGQLLDENGKAYASAEEAGITYTKSLSEGLQEAVEAIMKLVEALTGIPQNVSTTVTTRHEDIYGGGGGGGEEVPSAMGFSGWVTRPTRFLAGEAGPEHVSVTPQSQTPQSQMGPTAGSAVAQGEAAIIIDGQVLGRWIKRQNKAGLLPIVR